jgi:imidazolonepropionase-like amidohydrolase
MSCAVMAQTLIKNVRLIDGSGNTPQSNVSILIKADTIAAILPAGSKLPAATQTLDMGGSTIMPLLVSAHTHLGLIKGNTSTAANYTEANVRRQLQQYLHYGVGTVMALGTDHPLIFPLRDLSRKDSLGGARLFTAGYGFGVQGGVPPDAFGADIFRPNTPAEAVADVQKLAALHPDFIKIWVDGNPRMQPVIYQAIINEAHKQNIKVAAHVFYLEDARNLVKDGIDLLAHSVRDKEIDNALINDMKAKGVFYIPTLSLDEYNFIYAGQPVWMNDPFFINSLEPGVWKMLNSDDYRAQQQQDQQRDAKMRAFIIAVTNLHKLDSAGVNIAMGTDSGAFPVRAQGFSEHLELQLMVEAGINPLKVITYATANGARLLGISSYEGTLAAGKKADFMVLDGDPVTDIKNTRNIIAVWKNGKKQD